MVNGTETGKLLNQYTLGNHLTDAELKRLIAGLQIIFDFCRK